MSEGTGNIKNKAVNGFKWGLIDNVSNYGIAFLVGLILANLLSPEEFGILATITIFINISLTIIDGGFATALIRKINCTENDYNTVFYSNLIFSVFLMLILIIGAPSIASYFNQPVIKEIIITMSIILIINACSIIPKTILVKRIDFKSQAFVSLASTVISGIIGIIMAIMGYGVWSMVAQQICRQFVFTLCIWCVISWKPRLIFSVASFKELFGFGIKLLFANLINSIFKDIFLVIIGKIYSSKDLGYYNRAEQFNLMISSNLSIIIQKVSLPTLSQFKNDFERMRFMYRKFTFFSAIITFPLVFGLAAAAKPVICILVGDKWLPSVVLLQIILVYGAIYPFQILNLNVLNIKKRSDLLLRLEVLKKFLFIPVIMVGYLFSLKSMLVAAVIYYYIEFFINGWFSKKLIGYSTINQVVDLMPIYLISIIISLIVWTYTFLELSNIIVLLLQVFTAYILYNIAFNLIGLSEFKEFKQIIKTQVSTFIYRKQNT